MQNEYKFSIITVCKNGEKTIKNTIESMLRQNLKDYEYIIIDGKSSDKTLNIIDSYKNEFNKNQLKVISEQDNGIYDAMNKGINISQGELIGIINSDDWYEDDSLDKVWKIYEVNRIKNVIIYGRANLYIGNILDGSIYLRHEFLRQRMIPHNGCFVANSVYKKIGLFNCQYPLAADYDFLLRAMENNIDFIGTDELLANMREGGASSSMRLYYDNNEIHYRHGIYGKGMYLQKKISITMRICKENIRKKLLNV